MRTGVKASYRSLRLLGLIESPLLGPAGNKEFLLYARRGGS